MKKIIKNILLSGMLLLIAILTADARISSEENADLSAQESFNLIVYGKNLDPAKLDIMLKTNPVAGSQWTEVLEIIGNKGKIETDGNNKLLIFRRVSTKRYFGRDIRENYIAVRFYNGQKDHPPEISAIYAIPSDNESASGTPERYINWIEKQPLKMESLSLASHIRPRPIILKSGKAFTEHIEAPVRQFKPGVREVEWLEILFK